MSATYISLDDAGDWTTGPSRPLDEENSEEDLRHVRMGTRLVGIESILQAIAGYCRKLPLVLISTIGGTSRGGCTRMLDP